MREPERWQRVFLQAGFIFVAVLLSIFAVAWVLQKVLVKEASTRVIEVPAVYETVSEQVMVEPATTAWKNKIRGVD